MYSHYASLDLHHRLNPVINETDAFMQDFHVECFRCVSCLVRVHCDSGCEKNCRDAVVDKDSLVGETIENVCECLASVIAETKV